MLSAFALPANAEAAFLNLLFEDITIESDAAYDYIYIGQDRSLTVKSGATLTVSAEISFNYRSKLVIEEGAALVLSDGGSLVGETGVVVVYGSMTGNIYSNPYAYFFKGSIAVYPGANLNVRDKISVFPVHSIAADPLDVTTDDNGTTYVSHTHKLVNGKCVGCDYACPNHGGKTKQMTVCADCGTAVEPLELGSTVSDGNLTILVGVAAAVVFGLGGFFLGKMKKKQVRAEE